MSDAMHYTIINAMTTTWIKIGYSKRGLIDAR